MQHSQKLHNYPILAVIILCICAFFSFDTLAQRNIVKRCSNNNMSKQYQEGLNNAIQKWTLKQSNNNLNNRGARGEIKFTVPIVIHIIHNGEAVGTGVNISETQIIKQIESTNSDFLGDNNWGDTIQEYKSRVGFSGIKFVLAKQDPYGRPTNGIVRINGGKAKWKSSEENTFMSLSYWPAEDYINIWVIDLVENDGTFAYSTFPKYQKDGLSDSEFITPQNYEGLYVGTKYFGTNKDGGQFNLSEDLDLGKTLTHELGHYFGLLHTWGDGTCKSDDYVDDTPLMFKETIGDCNYTKSSCGSVDMIQNFMDYTNDKCMTAFTNGQVTRMQAVLNNAFTRKSLLTSHALIDPTNIAERISIKATSIDSKCTAEYSLNYQLINVGTTTVNSYTQTLANNGITISNNTINKTINAGVTTDISQLIINLKPGKNIVTLRVVSINGNTVETMPGSTLNTVIYYSPPSNLPFLGNSSDDTTYWSKIGDWQTKNVTINNSSSSTLFADMTQNTYSNYELHSNSFELGSSETATVSFELSYYSSSAALTDLLAVWVLSCDNSALKEKIFVQFEADLITASSGTPSSDSEWAIIIENIPDKFKGHRVKIVISAQNNNAGKLYIQNLKVRSAVLNNINLNNQIISKVESIKLYPNPVQGNYLKLKLNKDWNNRKTVEIIDKVGVVIRVLNIEKEVNNLDIFVGDLKKGVYILRVLEKDAINDAKKQVSRFIKL